MFIVTVKTEDGEWIGATVLDNGTDGRHKALIDAAEKNNLHWTSSHSDDYESLLADIEEFGNP